MKILMQFAIVFCICLVGEGISAVLPFPFPASVIDMILVFLFLYTGVLRVYHISEQADFILGNMAFFFIGPAVSIADNLHYLGNHLPVILLICTIVTIGTFLITAYTVTFIMKLMERKQDKQRGNA